MSPPNATTINRSRHSSPLLHEIQPPRRRLSSHQMLLLTPFGGAIPAGAMRGGMTRIGSSMGSTAQIRPSPTVLGRVRHHSLNNPPAPSPLSSAPMTTIQSASEHSSSSSAGPERVDRADSSATLPGTVAMTRSNSLPVLTLRELDALKQKDGELGIARGGDWAWVSRESGEYDDIPEGETPGLIDHTASASTTSLASASSVTPPSLFPTFHDPFAAAGLAVHDTLLDTPIRVPVSTSEGYHYSPTGERRMSEAPLGLPSAGPSRLESSRIPSAPIASQQRPIRHIMPLPSSSPFISPPAESPHGTPSTSPARPRMMRYRSAPGRSTGLGLRIVVKPQHGPPLTGPDSDSEGSSPNSVRGRRQGGWTAVDVVDPLAAGDDGLHPDTAPALLHVAHRSSFNPKAEFGVGRSRFESVDSALPFFNERFMSLPRGSGLWSSTFPRRGSLAVLSRTPLGPWAVKGLDTLGVGGHGHWSERRGSWAEERKG